MGIPHINDGFQGQRLVRCPREALNRCRRMPMTSDLYITDIGHFPNTKHHHVKRREGCLNHIFIYNSHGMGWAKLGNHRFQIPPEHGIMIPAGEPHAYGANNAVPWEIYWFHFNGQKASAVLDTLELSPENPMVFIPEINILTTAFEDTFRWTRTGLTDAALIAMSAALTRFFSLLNIERCAPAHQSRQNTQRIQDIISLMHERLDWPWSLTDWAREACLSVPQFCVLFRKQTGCAPMRFLTRLRMQKACQLLDLTDRPIHVVAGEVGFEDPFHFSRNFKQVIGISPRNYRQTIKG